MSSAWTAIAGGTYLSGGCHYPLPYAALGAGGWVAMQAEGLAYRVLFVLATILPGSALAEEPVRGLVQFDYVAHRPESGGDTGNAQGYEIAAGRVLPHDFVVFAEYEHLPHPLLAPLSGQRDEDDYEAGAKFTYPLNDTLHWLTELAYEEEHDSSASGTSVERGYDFVQGLRIEAAARLELIADLHHETVGSATNAVVLGFVRGFGSRFGFVGEIERSRSGGRDSTSYHLGVRVYY